MNFKRQIIFWFLLILFLQFTLAVEFVPSSVKSMDVNVTLNAIGNFSGKLSEKDRMEIKILTFKESKRQKILKIEERLHIGEDVFKPRYEIYGNNRFAVFEIEDLKNYENDREFKIVINARLKTEAGFEIEKDEKLEDNPSAVEVYLEATKYIESDDRTLQSKADIEFKGNSKLEVIREIVEWVGKNIEYDFENYYDDIWSAKDTYEARRGVCDEFANLTAAFARIKKIPVKYISGISFDGERFGNHGWNEVYINGEWIGVDATYGEAGYLDGAHIVLAEGKDASEIKNVEATTWSVGKIDLTTKLEEPIVEINEIEFFDGLTEINLEHPKELGLGEKFEVKAFVKSKSDKITILPFRLIVNEKFMNENEKKLVLFETGKEKTIEWDLVSPAEGKENEYYEFQMLLLSPDRNLSRFLKVLPGKAGEKIDEKRIELKEINPVVENDALVLEFRFLNKSLEDGKIKIETFHRGEVKSFEEILPEFTEKKLVYEIKGVKAGKFGIEISGDYNETIEFSIPEKVLKKEKITEISYPEKKLEISEFEENPVDAAVKQIKEDYGENILLWIAGTIVLLLFMIFGFKAFLKK